MDVNKAKWYGILSTFVVALLQTFLTYALFSLVIFYMIGDVSRKNLGESVNFLTNFLDFFIPILFLVCLRWSRTIGLKIIIEKQDAHKTALKTLNVVLTVAHVLTILASIVYSMVLEGSYKSMFGSIIETIIGFFSAIIFGSCLILVFNYFPNTLGAIPLSRFLKRYQ